MIDIDIYAICTEKSERSSNDDEWFASFEEAMANRMKYANWWRPNGDIWIKHYHNGPSCAEEWHIGDDGQVINYFNWNKKGSN